MGLDPAGFLLHIGPGTKDVILLPPWVSEELNATTATAGGQYPPRKMNLFAETLVKDFPTTAPLVDHPDLVRVSLQRGDILYIPCGWYHQVQYVGGPSVSVTVMATHFDYLEHRQLTMENCWLHAALRGPRPSSAAASTASTAWLRREHLVGLTTVLVLLLAAFYAHRLREKK